MYVKVMKKEFYIDTKIPYLYYNEIFYHLFYFSGKYTSGKNVIFYKKILVFFMGNLL
jgi:hypothetical protein